MLSKLCKHAIIIDVNHIGILVLVSQNNYLEEMNMGKNDKRTLNQYIAENPNNLTPTQFDRIVDDLMSNGSSGTIHDETYDFYQWLDGKPGRQEQFYKFIKHNYESFFGKNED